MNFEKIKKFLEEKIFHKRPQKLLMPAENEYIYNQEKINLDDIFSYINESKYVKGYKVLYMEIPPKVRKKLIKKIENLEKGAIDYNHDNYPIVEGSFSREYFISVRRKNVKLNKVGQTIVTDDSYIDISTRKKYKNNVYNDLYYREILNKNNVKEICEYDEENEAYSRTIKLNRHNICRKSII